MHIGAEVERLREVGVYCLRCYEDCEPIVKHIHGSFMIVSDCCRDMIEEIDHEERESTWEAENG